LNRLEEICFLFNIETLLLSIIKPKLIIFITLFLLILETSHSSNYELIEWTVPPEGGYGKYIFIKDDEVHSIDGEYSPNKKYWWKATYKFDDIIFKGEIESNKVPIPTKGYYVFQEFQNEKFYIDNRNNTNCSNFSCQYYTKVIWENVSIDISTLGLSEAITKFKKKKIEIKNEKKKQQEKNKLAQDKKREEERKKLEEEKLAQDKKREEERKKLEEEKLLADYNYNKLVKVASGSGFYLNDSGVIVTNYHVIEECETVKVGDIKLSLITYDIYNDLALLNSYEKNTPFLKLRSDKLKQGEDIYVVGYPFGKDISSSAKITKGIITAIHGIANDYSKFQIDAPIQSGNSGGPVLDNKGLLIGVAVAKADTEYFIEQYGVIPDDMNFAVKTSILKTMMDAHNIFQKNIKLMEVTNGSDVFKIANPSTLYLTCYMKHGEILKIYEN